MLGRSVRHLVAHPSRVLQDFPLTLAATLRGVTRQITIYHIKEGNGISSPDAVWNAGRSSSLIVAAMPVGATKTVVGVIAEMLIPLPGGGYPSPLVTTGLLWPLSSS